MGEKIHQLNDRTMKYITMAQTRRQHEYLGLPGEYIALYPHEIVFPNMDAGRVDSYYATTGNILVNLEEESDYVNEKTFSKLGKYAIFGDYFYSRKLYTVVICHKDPEKGIWMLWKITINIHQNTFHTPSSKWTVGEIWNVINKVKQKEKLTEREALDIAFIPKFISKEKTQNFLDSLTNTFKNAIIEDRKLRMDVGIILGGMILKHIKNKEKRDKLLGRINMKQIKTDLENLVYDEFGEELDAKDKEIEELKNSNKELKSKVKELNELKDFNSPKAKQIIQSMMLLWEDILSK